jgi:hypothetical protein
LGTKISLLKGIILPDVRHSCETSRLVFENRVLRRLFVLKREVVAGAQRKNYIRRNFIICRPTPSEISHYYDDQMEEEDMN